MEDVSHHFISNYALMETFETRTFAINRLRCIKCVDWQNEKKVEYSRFNELRKDYVYKSNVQRDLLVKMYPRLLAIGENEANLCAPQSIPEVRVMTSENLFASNIFQSVKVIN